MKRLLLLMSLLVSCAFAQTPTLSPAVKSFVTVDAPIIALMNVRVIDGTGAPAREEQMILIRNGRIESVQRQAGDQLLPKDTKVLNLTGYTVIPGLVGMHDHLFYPGALNPIHYSELDFSAPRLYLAGGVTTIRTTGSLDAYTDLSIKRDIDAGRAPGPKIFPTGPYLEGVGAYTPQMHELKDADDARRTVAYWTEEGAHDFKAYMHITRAELSAAIEEAHKRGLKVTGHLCSIGFHEAAALGIDDLEHGLVVDGELDFPFNAMAFYDPEHGVNKPAINHPGKQPDKCPEQTAIRDSLLKLDVNGSVIQDIIKDLVAHHVAVTSTLPVFETFVPNRPAMSLPPAAAGAPPKPSPYMTRVLDSMLPESRNDYLTTRARIAGAKDSAWPELFKKEMQFEYAFVKAGGLLLAGLDPTGYGGVVAGFGDHREVELLVEAGFTPVEAIKIATLNGAQWLGVADKIGSIVPGKQADIVVIKGDPSKNISDIENVETVFKDGVGYDSAKLIDSARGRVGLH
jgi:imidazolonepropionase-like amidohydrolase